MSHSDLYPDIKFSVNRNSEENKLSSMQILWANHSNIVMTDSEHEILLRAVNKTLALKQKIDEQSTLIEFSEEVHNIRVKERLDKI